MERYLLTAVYRSYRLTHMSQLYNDDVGSETLPLSKNVAVWMKDWDVKEKGLIPCPAF